MSCKYNSNAKQNPSQHHSSFHLPAHSNSGLVFLFPGNILKFKKVWKYSCTASTPPAVMLHNRARAKPGTGATLAAGAGSGAGRGQHQSSGELRRQDSSQQTAELRGALWSFGATPSTESLEKFKYKPKGEWSVAERTTFMEYLCNERS